MSRLRALFSGRRTAADAEALVFAVSLASRRHELYGDNGAPDTLEGRLEMLTLHACLALIRLKRDSADHALSQRFADQLFRHIDAGLREAGVGDLSVPRRMRRIASQFYGRLSAYAAALESADSAALADALSRNAGAAGLAAHVQALHDKQAHAPAAALLTDAGWTWPAA